VSAAEWAAPAALGPGSHRLQQLNARRRGHGRQHGDASGGPGLCHDSTDRHALRLNDLHMIMTHSIKWVSRDSPWPPRDQVAGSTLIFECNSGGGTATYTWGKGRPFLVM
jgi:hypothetical protein